MSLENVRDKIDQIDYGIFKLLNERMELACRVKKLKDFIFDSERETQVLEQLKKYSRAYNLVPSHFVEKVFKEIISESRKSQEKKRSLIGFQGEHGAFSEEAARFYGPDLIPIPCAQFADVFEGVERDQYDLGIVPVENSLGGAVTQVNELLIRANLRVVGAVKLRINHCLLVLPEMNYREIRIVYSHPQGLSQCREFLNRHQLEGRPFYDTAGAAQMLSKEKPKMAAAIASKLCAELYNLDVIKENIEDHKVNFTRFLVLANKDRKGSGNKHSLVFSTPHKAGTLFEVLKIFADAGINLTRIESLPSPDDPGNYAFFLDFQSSGSSRGIDEILQRVKTKTKMLKYLGCYQEKEGL